MAGVTAFIPLVGAPLAAGIGAVLLLPEGASAAVTFASFFLLLQQVESGLIGPRVVGAGLGLSPVWTLLAMLLGGGLFGIAGAVLAVPVAAALKTLLSQ
jgi:predicted PurR-regulated permease PerM